jgi:hypothetical protein
MDNMQINGSQLAKKIVLQGTWVIYRGWMLKEGLKRGLKKSG